jgi:hypothetical protein
MPEKDEVLPDWCYDFPPKEDPPPPFVPFEWEDIPTKE